MVRAHGRRAGISKVEELQTKDVEVLDDAGVLQFHLDGDKTDPHIELNGNSIVDSGTVAWDGSASTLGIPIEDLTTAGAAGTVPTSDGAGALTMQTPGLAAETVYQAGEPVLADAGYLGTDLSGPTDRRNNITGHVQGVGTSIESIALTPTSVGGATVDPTDGTLWFSNQDDNKLERIARDGTSIEELSTNVNGPEGVATQVSGPYLTLWYCSFTDTTIYHLDKNATILSSFSSKSNFPRGIGVDPTDGTIWYTDNGDDTIYHLQTDGTTISSFAAQGTSPTGIGVDPRDGSLWYCESSDDTIYHLNRDGTVIESFAAQDSSPHGIGVDMADGSLWYTENDTQTFHHLSSYDNVWTGSVGGHTVVIPRRSGV